MSIKLLKFYLTHWQRGASFYLLFMIIFFKVAILKIMYNMASLNINMNFKTCRQDDPLFSLTLTSILLGAHNNEKHFIIK